MQRFHAAVQSWIKHGGGNGFELLGEPHKVSGTGMYDKVRLRRLPPNTSSHRWSSNQPLLATPEPSGVRSL
jgi:hypothetical protein